MPDYPTTPTHGQAERDDHRWPLPELPTMSNQALFNALHEALDYTPTQTEMHDLQQALAAEGLTLITDEDNARYMKGYELGYQLGIERGREEVAEKIRALLPEEAE